ncbi:hypothetical protein Ae201684_014602 [Aphanomyces euteiches]|uniref:Uncharacterized protein n=1 Tax=Aphanomyces euteiches TaxID=100861 RepID=A0A6G0WJC9_9STRA|nr:hypothetical protein Ae201684_014602 [Aphanomyces euteiches]
MLFNFKARSLKRLLETGMKQKCEDWKRSSKMNMATPEEKFPQEDAAIASANYPSALELYTKAIKTPHMLFGNRSARQNHPKQMLMIKPFQLIQQGRR